jgi:hypothetical protein
VTESCASFFVGSSLAVASKSANVTRPLSELLMGGSEWHDVHFAARRVATLHGRVPAPASTFLPGDTPPDDEPDDELPAPEELDPNIVEPDDEPEEPEDDPPMEAAPEDVPALLGEPWTEAVGEGLRAEGISTPDELPPPSIAGAPPGVHGERSPEAVLVVAPPHDAAAAAARRTAGEPATHFMNLMNRPPVPERPHRPCRAIGGSDVLNM